MRIVAGTARGRVLAAPERDEVIRPTADRVRETIFNVLGQTCDGYNVLDLYAGTGALAFEALSRGASRAVLVDTGREAHHLIRKNAEALDMSQQLELIKEPAARALQTLARRRERFELVFSDPPYKQEAGLEVLTALDEHELLSEGGVLVLEHAKQEALPEKVGRLTRIDERAFGGTVVSMYRFHFGEPPPAS
ncbi:MAG: 16S rRNA (guanine(966)-N(2))-methyltransferase RsmD [Myxococcales bacterium]|nr:16S rRNA (guanine(966)-N(2))-methyltransferase RsmD [Myxococcales bacterium]